MAEGLSVEIKGLDRVVKALSPSLINKPLRRFWERSAEAVRGEARHLAPVDTGKLRNSIAIEIDSNNPPQFAKVGTNVHYAPYQEFGTGLQTDGEGGGSGHWPPAKALDSWAKKHGFPSGAAVAAAIGGRGGLLPKRFMRDGLKNSMGKIDAYVGALADEIEAEWADA